MLEEMAVMGHGSTWRVKPKLADMSLYDVSVSSVGTEMVEEISTAYSPIQSRSLLKVTSMLLVVG